MFYRKDFTPLCNVGVKDQWGYRPNPKPGQGYGMTIHHVHIVKLDAISLS